MLVPLYFREVADLQLFGRIGQSRLISEQEDLHPRPQGNPRPDGIGLNQADVRVSEGFGGAKDRQHAAIDR